MSDYYAELGVGRGASEDEIRSAYRKLAMRHHPDRLRKKSEAERAQAEEKFKRISEANAILSDPEKRRHYDAYGTTDGFGAGGGAGTGGFGGAGGFGGFGDIFRDFGDLFGGAGGRQREDYNSPRHGEDLRERMEVSLAEAYAGVEREIQYVTLEACDKCDGAGHPQSEEPKPCPQCDGRGVLHGRRGLMMVQQTCPRCQGAGETRTPCTACNGDARVQRRRKIKVSVPPGIDSGQILRLSGKGCDGVNGGGPGDLYVEISVRAQSLFERDDMDLHCELPLTLRQALLGDKVRVPTMEGNMELKVPAGVQPGGRLRLRGKGMPALRGSERGDMILTVAVHLPRELDKAQRKAVEQLDDTLSQGQREGRKTLSGWLDKIGGFFSQISDKD